MYFSCMDCRLQPSLITDTRPGDMFIVRNPGNLIPHARHCTAEESVTGESAALELTCVKLEIRDVIVCGHSDCKVSGRKIWPTRRNIEAICAFSVTVHLMYSILTPKRNASPILSINVIYFEQQSPELPIRLNWNKKLY